MGTLWLIQGGQVNAVINVNRDRETLLIKSGNACNISTSKAL